MTIFFRIWKTFLALDAPLELNVKNKESVVYYIESHKYAIFSKAQALNIFKDIEIEVKIFLVRFLFYLRSIIIIKSRT